LYAGFNAGINYSKINYENTPTKLLLSYQLAFDLEYFFLKIESFHFSLLSGLYYESRRLEESTFNNDLITYNFHYITLPFKFRYTIDRIAENTYSNIQWGGFLSSKIDSDNSHGNRSNISDFNYGILFGANVAYFFENDKYIFIEYNFQFGISELINESKKIGTFSHVFNIGYKFEL